MVKYHNWHTREIYSEHQFVFSHNYRYLYPENSQKNYLKAIAIPTNIQIGKNIMPKMKRIPRKSVTNYIKNPVEPTTIVTTIPRERSSMK
jgi:hypothetical protein